MDYQGHGFRDPRLAYLFDYWRSKKGERIAASRTDLLPSEIKHFLPIMNLIDVRRDPLRFRHRLVGTEIVDRLGRDVTGELVSAELYGPAYERVFEGLKAVAEEVRPYRRLTRLSWYDRSWLSVESLELPLIDSGGEVNMILRAASHFSAAQHDGRDCEVWPLAA
ncbi:PAS domain-containing protein [Parvibaculum sp.]|uniref:PAS domain-containing protein n=1 Tax=Parvibaculum sp. TaxID=2024848 RepID=UPI00391BDFAE